MNLFNLTLLNFAAQKPNLYFQSTKSFGTRFIYQKKGYFQNIPCLILHRAKGPAYISHGTLQWWYNSQRHRKDPGPTFIAGNTCQYHKYNKLHRLDGPAIEYKNSLQKSIYYIDNVVVSQQKYWSNPRVKSYIKRKQQKEKK